MIKQILNINFCILVLFSIFLITSCEKKNPNVNDTGKDELKAHEIDHEIIAENQKYNDIIYIPIYSDIYIDTQNQKNLLAATLSIRNTSYTDTIFISKIDYFNTRGDLVRKFIKNPISLPPMGTINYVIEKEDDTGGSGANFIVDISARNKHVRPIVQAIMIGQNGNKGFSFVTDGYSIKQPKK